MIDRDFTTQEPYQSFFDSTPLIGFSYKMEGKLDYNFLLSAIFFQKE